VLRETSRKHDAGAAIAQERDASEWDLAIAWGRGRHVTVFPPPRWLLVSVLIALIAAAWLANIWLL